MELKFFIDLVTIFLQKKEKYIFLPEVKPQ